MEQLLQHPLVKEACITLHVPYLYHHLSLVLFSTIAFFALQALSSQLSPHLFPKEFAKLSKKTRLDWDLHFVRLVTSSHCCL